MNDEEEPTPSADRTPAPRELPRGWRVQTRAHGAMDREHFYAVLLGPGGALHVVDSADGQEWRSRGKARRQAIARAHEIVAEQVSHP